MIAVNLITGFLGVGKTTCIQHLLNTRPDSEKIAVLVNEFGEIGVDGSLLSGDDISIQEVPGGCLCCVSAPAFTVGLNKLIRQKPDRILIEPSGLGHPAQVLETLRNPPYNMMLDVQATLCLIDPRHLDSVRHLEHQIFQDQIHLADVLIANKGDLTDEEGRTRFYEFIRTLPSEKEMITWTENGQVEYEWLKVTSGETHAPLFPEAHAFLIDHGQTEAPPSPSWQAITGYSDGYHRASWLIPETEVVFNHDALVTYLDSLSYERIKGLFQTDKGVFSYNRSGHEKKLNSIEATAQILEVMSPEKIDFQDIQSHIQELN